MEGGQRAKHTEKHNVGKQTLWKKPEQHELHNTQWNLWEEGCEVCVCSQAESKLELNTAQRVSSREGQTAIQGRIASTLTIKPMISVPSEEDMAPEISGGSPGSPASCIVSHPGPRQELRGPLRKLCSQPLGKQKELLWPCWEKQTNLLGFSF